MRAAWYEPRGFASDAHRVHVLDLEAIRPQYPELIRASFGELMLDPGLAFDLHEEIMGWVAR